MPCTVSLLIKEYKLLVIWQLDIVELVHFNKYHVSYETTPHGPLRQGRSLTNGGYARNPTLRGKDHQKDLRTNFKEEKQASKDF